MRLYRNHYATMEEGSAGFQWFTSKAAARRAAREADFPANEESTIAEPVEYVPTRAGIVELLNRVASHADNG